MKPSVFAQVQRGGGFEHKGAISVTGYLHIGGVIGTSIVDEHSTDAGHGDRSSRDWLQVPVILLRLNIGGDFCVRSNTKQQQYAIFTAWRCFTRKRFTRMGFTAVARRNVLFTATSAEQGCGDQCC